MLRSMAKFYRVTVGNREYYSYLKGVLLSEQTWKTFLELPSVKWLPRPPSTISNMYCLFTELGYQEFLRKTVGIFPLAFHVDELDSRYLDLNKVIYKDDFQVIWGDKFD